MSVVTEFSVPAETFALAQTMTQIPEAEIRVERLATHSREWVMPVVTVTAPEIDAVEPTLEADPTVSSVTTLDETAHVGSFNVRWDEDVQQLVDLIVDQHGIVLDARARDEAWYLKLKFVSRDALEDFREYFLDRDYPFDLHRLYETERPNDREYDLTAEQREALVTALELGYFEVPRDANLEELAAELDISTNAASQRLRRATGNLSRNTLTSAFGDANDDGM